MKNFHKLRSFLTCWKVYLKLNFSLWSILEGETDGFAFARKKLIIKRDKQVIAYPKYREKISRRAILPSLDSVTARAGMAKPNPDPMILAPTIIEVAKAL
jgi:hypothetical protein